MGHVHLLVAEVGRCTVDAVVVAVAQQSGRCLVDGRRGVLVFTAVVPSVGQRLAEVQIVVGPDGIVVRTAVSRVMVQTLVVVLGYGAAGIDEVAVAIAVLDVVEGIVGLGHVPAILQRQRAVGVGIVGIPVLVGIGLRLSGDVVVETLVQVETVEVVGHLAVVELVERLRHGQSVHVFGGHLVRVGLGVVAVHYLPRLAA